MRLLRFTAASAAAAAMVLSGANAASAHTDVGTARFDNGQVITANAWIQSFTWTGCGNWQSSAVMNVSPVWIRNTTAFYQYGLGSLSVKGVSISASRVNDTTLQWTNSNGAKGSYLSGSVCGGWGAVYVGYNLTGTAYYYGNVRTASARV